MSETPPRHGLPPSLADIEAIALAARESLPPVLRTFTGALVVHVEEFPDAETLADLGCESPFDLLGLYRGVDLARQSTLAIAEDVDRIFLYRRPLLDYWCETAEDLTHLVRHVMIHEIGHHFGLSDEDMERIESES